MFKKGQVMVVEDTRIFGQSVFGGFKKTDVLAYIDEMATKAKQNEEELGQRLEILSNKRVEYLHVIDDLEKKLEVLGDELRAEQGRAASMAEQLTTLQKQVVEKNDQIVQREEAMARQAEETKALQARLREPREYKQQQFERIVEAKKTADRILEDARKRSQQVDRRVDLAVSSLMSDLAAFQKTMEEAKAEVRDSLVAIENRMSNMTETAKVFEKRFAQCKAELKRSEGSFMEQNQNFAALKRKYFR